jgi:hypothetical protein
MSMRRDRCRWVQPRIPLLAGGELRGHDRRRVERHLIGCGSCRERLGRVSECLQVLQIAGQQGRASDSHQPLWPALSREIQESRREGRPGWWSWGPLAASLLIAVSALGIGAWGVSQQYQIIFRPRPYPTVQIAKRPPRPAIRNVSTASLRRELPATNGFDPRGTPRALATSERPEPGIPTN